MRQARANIEKLRTAAESTTTQLTGMPGGGQIGDKVGSGAARIADAEEQFRQMELDAIETMAEIVRVIDMVENTTQAEVLHHGRSRRLRPRRCCGPYGHRGRKRSADHY